MLSSDQISAFLSVIEEGSFQLAAKRLHVTSSAVSQRIKLLEEVVGQVLLERASPCMPTAAGSALLAYARQSAHLEEDALRKIQNNRDLAGSSTKVCIVVNADSLATWFLPALQDLALSGVQFDIQIEDQDFSSELLQSGRAIGVITSKATPAPGCRSVKLGAIEYLAVASSKFKKKFFSKGVTAEALGSAPTLIFNRKDDLQHRYLRMITKRKVSPPVHYLPSSNAFVSAAILDLGWGMNPRSLVSEQLKKGDLVEIIPDSPLMVNLYWQHWNLDTELIKRLSVSIIDAANKALNP
jgi:LysR family transcriptional regulator (chromosome initiation inhibitor)